MLDARPELSELAGTVATGTGVRVLHRLRRRQHRRPTPQAGSARSPSARSTPTATRLGASETQPSGDRLRSARRLRRLVAGRAPAQPAPGQTALGRRAGRLRALRRWSGTSRSSAPAGAATRSPTAWPRASRAGSVAAVAAGFATAAAVTAATAAAARPARPAKAQAPTRALWLVRRTGGDAVGLAPPLCGLPAGPDRGRRAALHRRRDALRGARQALHLHQHRQRPGQDLRGQRHRRHRSRSGTRRWRCSRRRGDRHHHLPGTVHPGGLRRARRPPARGAVRSRPRHVHPPLARGPRRKVRGRRAVEAPLVLPAAGRGHGCRGAARVRGHPQLRRLHGRHHAGQDRDPRQGRRRVPEPHLHERVQEAQAGLCPLRRDVHGGRDDLRRRRDPAPGRGPLLHDHHHRRRRQGAGLAGGMAADRVAGAGRALHLRDGAVDHHRRRRAQSRAVLAKLAPELDLGTAEDRRPSRS